MERRSGKDRRKHIDPRYQSAAYPEFVDRRSGVDGRKRSYHDLPGHPTRKLIIVMGVVVTLFIISLFFLTSLLLTEKYRDKIVPKKTVTFAYHQDGGRNECIIVGQFH
jgi:hypothetical protein